MSRLSEYFLSSKASVILLELIEIWHTGLSPAYLRYVRNKPGGVTVTQDGQQITYDYLPMRLSYSDSRDNLDSKLRIELGDLGLYLPAYLDLIRASVGKFLVEPVLFYRAYRSDDLSEPTYGPFRFKLVNITTNKTGTVIEASAEQTNSNRTGEIYSIQRFPMLRGFL